MREHEHRLAAYNAAFDKLGLDWRWDCDEFAALETIGDERERISAYIRNSRPHLLKVYDVHFLCDLIQATKARHDARAKMRERSAVWRNRVLC